MPASCKLLSEVDAPVLRVDEVGMSFDENPKSDRVQTIRAVLFMGIFAALFLIIVLPKDNIVNLVCNTSGTSDRFPGLCANVPSPTSTTSGELVSSRVTSACLDNEGLKISVTFGGSLAGASNIQVFSTGEDYFPSEQGISDSFRMRLTIPSAADHLDILIPVDAMPVGEQIFGNIETRDEDISSFVAFSMNVSDCSTTSSLPLEQTPESPVISSATCLPNRQLMIAFEFDQPVLGQYRALVDDIPYKVASVINQPAMWFFSGEPPSEGPVVIRLVSATNEVTVFEETYTPPVCGGA